MQVWVNGMCTYVRKANGLQTADKCDIISEWASVMWRAASGACCEGLHSSTACLYPSPPFHTSSVPYSATAISISQCTKQRNLKAMIALTESECKKKWKYWNWKHNKKMAAPKGEGAGTHMCWHRRQNGNRLLERSRLSQGSTQPAVWERCRERHARYMSRDSPWDSVLSVSCSQKRKRQHEHEAQSAQEANPTKSQTTSTNSMQRTTRNYDRERERERETHSRGEQ